MQIILIEDVKSLGKKGDVVKVNDGYARNFILPKKLGLEATERNLKELAIQNAEEEQRQKEIYDEAVAFGEKLASSSVSLEIKAGEGGRTFGSITAKEISQAIKEQLGYDIDKKKMVLADAIKNAGVYQVTIKLHPKVSVAMKVEVRTV